MFFTEPLREKTRESLSSVLPITGIVLVLSISIAPLSPGTLVLFLFGAVFLVVGMGLFTLGADIAMIPMGEGIGVEMSKSRRPWLPVFVCFALGLLITLAEPDLQVLAEQLPSIPNLVLILTVAVGVGVFLVLAELRMLLKIPLSYALLACYLLVFILAAFSPDSFIPAAFDSGGVTTGPITVPFIMALGIGMAAVRSDKNSAVDSFGLISLCSIGPILSVLLLGVFYQPAAGSYVPSELTDIITTRDAAQEFARALPSYAKEVLVSVLPIVGLFLLFQLFTRRFHGSQIKRISVGLAYTYVGLVLFLTGVNVGFLSAGQVIGSTLALSRFSAVLVPIGGLVGYFIVKAEPAVQILTKQVEEVSNGSISQKAIGHSLSIGVALSVALSMARILTGVSIFWFLIPGYALSLLLTFFVPQIFTGIAFDSGGVASGPMTTTFLLPLAMGACSAGGGDILTDAFGIVAMVAMTPLITIQLLGLASTLRRRAERRRLAVELAQSDYIIYYDEEESEADAP